MPETEKKSRRIDWKKTFGLYSYLGKYRKIFIPSVVALFVTGGLSLAFPYFLGSLIGSPQEAMQEGADPSEVGEKINKVVSTLLVILCVQAFVAYWRVRGFIKAGESALCDLRQDVFARLVRLPMPWFMERRTGEVGSRFSADLAILQETLITTIPQMVRQSVTFFGGLIFIFIASVKLSLFMLAMIPIVVIVVAIVGRKIRRWSKDAQDQLAQSNIVAEEAVQGIADVKAYSNEEFEEDRYRRALDLFLGTVIRGAKARAMFVSFIIFILFGTISVVVWFGAGMMSEGQITSEEFTHFILFSIFVGASLGSLPDIMSQLQKTQGATERIREILNHEIEDHRGESGETLTGAISAKDLVFAYPSRKKTPVLNGVNFEVNAGERIAIVGPSGAGKSTVFSLLLGFYEGDEGSLSFDGKDSVDIPVSTRRAAMAVVPQEVLLFGGTIRENIEYGRPGASEEEIMEAAQKANAHNFIDEFPEGYDAIVGPRGVKLSGGQRQRIAIARAVLADPKILLLDEATSALDSESERLVQEALNELMRGRTSLIIAHRLGTVKSADKILVLKDGKFVEDGSHSELMAQDGTYRLLAETQLLN
ncbi:ABC transporter transmembrane domain-containing protein [bacterium]|nr:ABC transporter transmembrane domain-containing protein [Akkermansiaceae bacterium]MDA7541028.1 ABC transporter transmembrane domain-containing protein [bacterium]MDA7607013.1 ABC transporter transmembrane domain-containing protein [Akkermansiaceae bacterium]MDA7655782.1 ABC transporter transmembrane domain-containing protein [Akkermansiaceae bacterium]MDA7661370.1 ABC transporter transmembrane domain-containing protein [bacterium]